VLRRLAQDVFDLCYPGVCANCKAGCDPGAFLCRTCSDQLRALEQAAACDLCAKPIASDGAPCPFCEGKGEPHYDRIFRLGTFDEPLKNLIHQMKYHGRWGVAERLAERLLAQPKVAALVAGADVLVPVPLHPIRHFNRGYNQAAVVARVIARTSGKRVLRPISRIRHTEMQTHLHTKQKRFENLRRAFRLRDGRGVRGKRVLVIDDVMTTGATLQTIARTFRPAGLESLSALVIAVADPKHRNFQTV